jgi:hypothetical protein
MSGSCFRHFGFDDRRQSVNTFEVFLVKVGLHQLDAEMPFNLQDELEDVDGIDFQFSAEQQLIVAKILRGQVGDPQALQYNGLELLLNASHMVHLQHESIPQSLRHKKCPKGFLKVVFGVLDLARRPQLQQSPIHSDHLPGDVTCLLRPQKRHQRSHFFGFAEAPQRDFGKQSFLLFLNVF